MLDFKEGVMHTLVLRKVPEDLYLRLKDTASAHHRSMTQEAIVSLRVALELPQAASRPSPQESLAWLEQQVWSLPVLDTRGADEILGYGDDGLNH